MESVITVRIDETVKTHATTVMKNYGLTPSQAVRKLFEYANEQDKLPFPEADQLVSKDIKRKIEAFDRCHTKKPLAITDDQLRDARLKERYGV